LKPLIKVEHDKNYFAPTHPHGTHVAGILAKLHLENRIQAAVEAVRSGIS